MNILEPALDQEQNFILMEDDQDKEQISNVIVIGIMRKNNMTKEEIVQNEKLLNFTIKKLKFENDILYRMMESVLGISRKKLRKIEKKQDEIEGREV